MLNYRNLGRLWRVYARSLLMYHSPRKLVNALRTEWAYRHRQIDVRSRPYFLLVEPLYYCNLACPLCDRQGFNTARRKRGEAGKLPLEVFDQVLDEIGNDLWQCHIFGLGEPLMDWPLTREIIERAHRKRIFTLVSTNCTLVTPDIAEDIMSSNLDHLVCAIDGISQESYGAYRVGGQVETALAGLKLLAETRDRLRSKVAIEWQFLINAFNQKEMEEARQMAEDLNVVIRFGRMRGMEWNESLQRQWLPPDATKSEGRVAPGEVANDYHCYHLWRSLVLNSNGHVTRCPIYQNVAEYGEVSPETPVMDLYNGASTQRARQLFSKGPVEDGPFPLPCTTCAFYKREHGGPNRDKGWTSEQAAREPVLISLDSLKIKSKSSAQEEDQG